jgi:alkylated DNA repair dioxygenase AlkB
VSPDPNQALLQEVAEQTTGDTFNSCLLNLYRHGQEYLGWHSDDESLYGKNAPICGISLGHARPFYLRKKSDHAHKLEYNLGNGDVFVMKGTTQTFWQHCVPKRASVPGARISLTFRHVKYPDKTK